MQPNQQDNQPYVSPSGSNVPEYLHLDPVVAKKPRSYRKLLLVISVLLFMGLLGVGVYIYVQWTQGEPERKFYAALNSATDESYLHRDITVTLQESKSSINLSVDSDFSNPDNPKSSITYNYDGSSTDAIRGEIVTLDTEKYAGRVMSLPQGVMKDIKRGQWYSASRNNSSVNDPDVFGVYTDTNSPVGSVFMGKFPADVREEVKKSLMTSGIYAIESASNTVKNGESYTVFKIKLNFTKLSQLTKELNSRFGSKLIAPIITTTNPVDVTVSNKSGKIVLVKESIKQGNFQTVIESSVNYPSSVNITMPTDIQQVP